MKKQGQSLVEAVVTIGVVLLLVSGLVVATTSTLRFNTQTKARTQALSYAKEGLEIIRMLRDNGWSSIPVANDSYCLTKGQTTLDLSSLPPCEKSIDAMFSRTISFSNESDIGKSCQSSSQCRKVTVVVAWNESQGERSVTLSTYLTNWRSQ